MIRSASTREKTALLILLGLCIASRLLTGLQHIEAPDSPGALGYDAALSAPRLPGYPVFTGIVHLFTLLTGSVGTALALIGGLSIFAMILGALRFCNTRLDRPEGVLLASLFFFNPMLWVMGNHDTSDLMGGAIVLWILALTIRDDHAPRSRLFAGIALTGLLAGLHLSYLPFVLLPLLIAVFRTRRELTAVGVLMLGILLWLAPMILAGGWDEFVSTAGQQTEGHFEEDFEETTASPPAMEERRLAVVKGVVADGLGGYWEDRGIIAVIVTIGLLLLAGRGAWWMFGRETDGLVITVLSASIYIAWILLYQNVLAESRHVLPLIPIILTLLWAGATELMRSGWSGRIVVTLVLIFYGLTGTILAFHHTSATPVDRFFAPTVFSSAAEQR